MIVSQSMIPPEIVRRPYKPKFRTIQRLARRERVRRLLTLMFAGSTIAEMAESEGVSPRRVIQLFDREGFPEFRGPQHRVLMMHVRAVDFDVLDELAAEAGVSISEIATRIVTAVLSGGKESAAGVLGKLARPRRNYTRARA